MFPPPSHPVRIGLRGRGCRPSRAATGGSLAVLSAGLPGALALGLHLLPLPCNTAVVVGVWRGAARYNGPQHHAEAARIAVFVWAALPTLL